MKKNKKHLLAFFLLKLIIIQNAYTQTLIVFDDFEGNTLNTTLWRTNPPWGNIYTPNDREHYASYPNNQQVEVNNGTCKLHLEYTTPFIYTLNNINYTLDYNAGSLFSYNLNGPTSLSYGYGIFEMRCKLPNVKCKPAFWLYGECDEEIDVFEFFSDNGCNNQDMLMNVHEKENTDCSGDNKSGHRSYSGPNFFNEFHTYTLIWSPNEIVWYVDGNYVRKCIKDSHIFECVLNHPSLFPNRNDGLRMIITLSAVNKNASCDEHQNATMEIDYIKVWDNPPGVCEFESGNNIVCCQSIFSGNDNEDIWAENDLFASDILIKNGANVYWHATRSIEIFHDFETEDGSTFEADILTCIPTHNKNADRVIPDDSIPNVLKINSFVFTPNPSTGIFTITKETDAAAQITVYNLLGNVILKSTISPSASSGQEGGVTTTLDLTNHAKGIYFVTVTEGDKTYSQKVVVE